jgi:hypothetical protein
MPVSLLIKDSKQAVIEYLSEAQKGSQVTEIILEVSCKEKLIKATGIDVVIWYRG